MLTVAQVAELCQVKPPTVRQWISRGKLTRDHRGLISNEQLITWWDDQRNARMSRSA